GVVDGVTTSSAVVAHEMGGVLDKVKRVDGRVLGISETVLPRGGTFELSVLDDAVLNEIAEYMPLDSDLLARLEQAEGNVIIKAAGNLGYPMGLYIERVSTEILQLARQRSTTFEALAGYGADERTMIGIGSRRGLPVLVTIPQLIGGGAVGLAIGDSISITERASRLARMLADADVIVESAVALTQEVHDGPFETHTGHGLWSAWQGHPTYSLEGKTLIRIDLDPALERVWQAERQNNSVQEAIDKGLPKTKLFNVPFRMEMSGFARLETSIAITGDIGLVWPVMAKRIADRLKLELRFVSYPQQTPQGKAMREWIAAKIKPFSRKEMLKNLAV
ncbi:MAG TPA: hypothetical protein PLW35_10280, partial [Verrucomicrobiota bacterium]|nr:hypothetical protein [Verrucomicrobiota bacterium]